MADLETLRRIALLLPEVVETSSNDRVAFEVAGQGIAWTYRARPAPRKPRVVVPGVMAIRCPMMRKELLIEVAPERFFTDAHYRGYPAVLVRLAAVDEDELSDLLHEAWRIEAPTALLKRHTL